MADIELGVTVSDKITGFAGVVTGMVAYLTGCNQALVAPPIGADGALRDSHWFDNSRLTVDESKPKVAIAGDVPGFDKSPPVR